MNRNLEVLDAIKESYVKGRLVPFIGAGFSKNVEEFLTWDEFIEELSRELTEDKNRYYLRNKFRGYTFQALAAEYYAYRKLLEDKGDNTVIDRDSLRNRIQDEINTYMGRLQSKESEIHQLLLEMFSYIYTTNWDKLFEFQKLEDGKLIPIYSIGKISRMPSLKKENNKILVKMHGSCDDLKSLIALETDYWDLIHGKHRNVSLNILFQHDIMQRDFILIGFSFSDLNIINLVYIMDSLKRELNPNLTDVPKIFMIVFDDYDFYLQRYYSDLKGVDVYFINSVSESNEDKRFATEKFLYELALYKLQCLEKICKSTKKKEARKNIKELGGEIQSIQKRLDENFRQFATEEIRKLQKKVELINSNIQQLRRSRKHYEKLVEELEEEKQTTELKLSEYEKKLKNHKED